MPVPPVIPRDDEYKVSLADKNTEGNIQLDSDIFCIYNLSYVQSDITIIPVILIIIIIIIIIK